MLNIYDPDAMKVGYWLRHASQQQLLEHAHKTVSGLDAKFTEMILATTAEGILTPQIEIRDMIPHAIPHGRVTLLGDAAHSMTYCQLLSPYFTLCCIQS